MDKKERLKKLEDKARRMKPPAQHDGAEIRRQNNFRREVGKLWMEIEDEDNGPLPTVGRTYRDSFRGVTMNRTQIGRNRRIRVFKHNGQVKEDRAVLVLTPDFENKFWRPNAEVWVEPHPGYRNSWQLVGVYNFRDERIG